MQLKDRLREIRTKQGLTLKNLGEMTGLSASYMSDIERGRTAPSLKTVEALAGALGVSVQYLLTGVEFDPDPDPDELPEGLRTLLGDPRYRDELDADWVALLAKIQLRGKRPQTADDWVLLYLSLKKILNV